MRIRFASIALVLCLLALPALALAGALGCAPCCTRVATAPCDAGAEPCAELSPAPCCDVAPAANDAVPLRLADAPAPHAAPASHPAFVPQVAPARPPLAGAAPVAFDSPRRLSVVLRQ